MVYLMEEKNVFKVHFQLAQLRAALYQAMDEGDAARIREISAQIDTIQKDQWLQQRAQQSV